MFRLKDFILLLVIFSSMLAGILFPRSGTVFQPYLQQFLMVFVFLSFLPIRLDDIWTLLKDSPRMFSAFVVFKILILPLAIYALFLAVAPTYAASALLLSAISTGVTAPFISNLLGGNSALVMMMVVVTSPLIPFTLPALVALLLARYVDISFAEMFRMLALVVFVPVITVEILRRTAPRLLDGIMTIRYPLSLALFALLNLGVFSRYSDFFFQEPMAIFGASIVATVLGIIYSFLGVLFFLKKPMPDRIAGAVSMMNVNNVLVIVFASRFFGPLEPTVAAMYILPYFFLIIPLRIYQGRGAGKG